ncbi:MULTISPECIES: hypothetical protein [Kingella]|jgi:hypothetical protein|uniref:Uncharacterized protein n=1 Tax=Kingella bonacorsii TaxID=2796361 RepID=A0ABS1BU38_9NEIS|nr:MULTISPECIES: hypothetical protein [Kingella]MBK0396774.1 hypothetical protein [Kingella bonacorsii]
MSNKIPAYAGMTAVIVFQAAVGVLLRFHTLFNQLFGSEMPPFYFRFQAA